MAFLQRFHVCTVHTAHHTLWLWCIISLLTIVWRRISQLILVRQNKPLLLTHFILQSCDISNTNNAHLFLVSFALIISAILSTLFIFMFLSQNCVLWKFCYKFQVNFTKIRNLTLLLFYCAYRTLWLCRCRKSSMAFSTTERRT